MVCVTFNAASDARHFCTHGTCSIAILHLASVLRPSVTLELADSRESCSRMSSVWETP